MLVELVCPICRETMKYQRDMKFYKCSGCSAELWPDEERKGIRTKDIMATWQEQIDSGYYGNPKSKSNSNKRSRKKKIPSTPYGQFS